MQDNSIRLRHMTDAVTEALHFTEGLSREDLDKNRILQLALVRLFEVIGEAALGMSKDFRDLHPELPWSSMIAMRNRLIHGYFDVDLDIVWQTVKDDLPLLKSQLEGISI